jgi:hypothetical protein
MGRSGMGQLVSCVLVLLLCASPLLAADSTPAMLYTSGTAWVNGAHLPRPSAAIFAGDMLQTRSDSVANINAQGSTITVHSDSLVQYQGAFLRVEHGGVTVSTSAGVATTAGDVKVTPASNTWTEFNVTDVDGTVHILASKGDLTISDDSGVAILAQGQQTTRDEGSSDTDKDADKNSKKKKKNKKPASGAPPAAQGGILNAPVAIAAGAAVVGGVAVWVLVHNDNPASPSKPN